MENKDLVSGLMRFDYNTIRSVFEKTDRAEGTIREYTSRVYRAFNDFLAGRQIGRHTFVEFKRHLEGKISSKDTDKKLAVSSANLYLTSARCFLKAMHDLGLIPIDITKNVKNFKQSQGHRRDTLSEEDVLRMLDFLGSDASSDRDRNLIMFVLLVSNGLRIKEIVNIQYEDIDFAAKRLKILGKGRIEKEVVYVSAELADMIKSYCLRENFKTKDHLFYSRHHKYARSKYRVALTKNMINRIFTGAMKTLGIKTRTKTVHSTRHFYFTTLVRRSDLKMNQIMILGRLRSMNTILNYAHEADTKALWDKSNNVFDMIIRGDMKNGNCNTQHRNSKTA